MPTEFTGDCANCVGLCCVALARTRAGGFGADIPAGIPCHHLQTDNLCEIHARLRPEGWPACTVFDCFGAGQRVTQVTFGGTADWRSDRETSRAMFAAFHTMRHLMEMLRLLTEARTLARGARRVPVQALHDEIRDLTLSPAEHLVTADIARLRGTVGPLLAEVSEQHRAPAPRSKRLVPRAQLLGSKLRGQDLGRHNLRSALLIAADLRGARFDRTDLLGADLRDANLADADLGGAIFLTQQQLAAARGNSSTRLPDHLTRPDHWVNSVPPTGTEFTQ